MRSDWRQRFLACEYACKALVMALVSSWNTRGQRLGRICRPGNKWLINGGKV